MTFLCLLSHPTLQTLYFLEHTNHAGSKGSCCCFCTIGTRQQQSSRWQQQWKQHMKRYQQQSFTALLFDLRVNKLQ